MRTITQLREDIANLVKELGDMRAKCISEKRDPNEEERKLADKHLQEIKELEDLVALETKTQAALDQAKEPTEPPDKTPIDTDKERKEQEQRDKFASPGEFFQAVMRAGAPGGFTDPRLTTRAATGLSESIPSDGGFLVDAEMAAGLMQNVWSSGMVLPRVSKVTLSGNKTSMKFNGFDETSRVDGSRAGGIKSYWAAEADEKTKSKPKFRQIELTLHKMIGLCYATDELISDASALAQIINQGFRDEFDFRLTDAIINGTGAGQPLGILNAGCMVSITKEAGQTAATIVQMAA